MMLSYSLSTAQDAEVTFITGVNSNGTVAATSFDTWNGAEPPGYNTTSTAAKWGNHTAGTGATVTFGFDAASNWTATEQSAFTSTLALWSAVANINFVLVSDASSANIDLKRGSDSSAFEQHNYFRGGAIGSSNIGQLSSATISIDTSVGGFGPIGNANFDNYGGYPWEVLLHEEGHALGLGHAGPYNDGTSAAADPYQLGVYDSRAWSIMSYIQPNDQSAPNYSNYLNHPSWGVSSGSLTGAPSNKYYNNSPTTWMPLDIVAIQRLYGVQTSGPLSGGQTFGFNSNISSSIRSFFDFTVNTKPIVTLWDYGTGNTLDVSGYQSASYIDLHQGAYSSCGGLTYNVAIGFGAQIDTAIGGSGNDTLVANDDGDVLTGGAGADLMVGGAGRDIFRDSAANFSGDTLLGFAASDLMNVTDASYSSFAYQRSGSTVTLGGGQSVVFASGITGRLVVSADASAGVDLSLGSHFSGLQDFNGDGHSDFLFRNIDSGVFTEWQITGNTTANQETLNTYVNGGVDNGWQIQGTLDFNGDGLSDIVWRNTASGVTTIWNSTGSGFSANNYVTGSMGPSWTLAGFGDFNADGKDDLLWRNSDGTFVEWQSTGSSYNQVYSNPGVDTSWHIQAIADFTGDGKADILWRNNAGPMTVWASNGSGFTPNVAGMNGVDTSWHVVAAADFNGDGKDDLLLRNDSGVFSEWQSTGTGFTPNVYVGAVDNGWSLLGAYDFNDDGKADLLWRNISSGTFTIWQSTGNGFTPNVLVDNQVPTSWTLVTHHYDVV